MYEQRKLCKSWVGKMQHELCYLTQEKFLLVRPTPVRGEAALLCMARNENAQLYLAPPPLSPSTPNKALASPNKALATEHVLIESR